jgi:hypothetical protein
MTMILLSLIISFAAGLTVGLQIQRIVARLYAALHALQEMRTNERKKNTGVVRPGLNDKPLAPLPDAPARSAVVRPRVPVDKETEQKTTILASVRSRVAPK